MKSPTAGADTQLDRRLQTREDMRARLLATWQGSVCVAFVIDAFARRIVSWRISRIAHTGFVLDALDEALHDRPTYPLLRRRRPRQI
jgi:transposase InsO family protein